MPLPSHHSSLGGMGMARMFQLRIAVTEAWSTGPSHMPKPWMHWNSPPERLAPSSRYGVLLAVNSMLPDTCRAGAAPVVWPGFTVIGNGSIGLVAPWVSVAMARMSWGPAATLAQLKLYGEVVSVPMTVLPSKKSTLVTESPGSGSVAVACSRMVAGAVNGPAGRDSDTIGGRLAGLLVGGGEVVGGGLVWVVPLQTVPLRVNWVGTGLAPLACPLKPGGGLTNALVATDPL